MQRVLLYLVIMWGIGLLIPHTSVAQGKGYKVSKGTKKHHEAFPSPYRFYQSGWCFNAGITGTFGTQITPPNNDTVYGISAPIRPGLKVSVGRYFIFKKFHKLIKYANASFGYKGLWNTEEVTQTWNNQTQQINRSNFAHYLTLSGHLNNVISFSDVVFLQNSIGLNLDYRVAETTENDNGAARPNAFVGQLNYSLGLGFMVDNNFAVIPYAEVPVFNLTPTQKEFNRLDYYNASYQTCIIGVKLLWFTFGQKDCPTAIDPAGNNTGNNGY